jgi:hypothetical protein
MMVREEGMDDVIASRSFSTGVGDSRRRRCFLVNFFSRLPFAAVEASTSLGSDIGDRAPVAICVCKAENLEIYDFTWQESWEVFVKLTNVDCGFLEGYL